MEPPLDTTGISPWPVRSLLSDASSARLMARGPAWFGQIFVMRKMESRHRDRVADHPFAFAGAVELRRIHERHAMAEALAQGIHLLMVATPVLPETPGALADHAQAQTPAGRLDVSPDRLPPLERLKNRVLS